MTTELIKYQETEVIYWQNKLAQ